MNRSDRYYEKLELIYRAYERSLDLDVAFAIVPLSDEERQALLIDPELEARIVVLDAKVKEELVVGLRDLGRSAESEGVRLAAIKELGKTFYPKRFKEDSIPLKLPSLTIRYEEVG